MNHRLTNALRARPHLLFLSYSINLALYTYLLAIGARVKIIVLGGIFSAAALGFVYVCVRGGSVLSGGKRFTADDTPRDFWLSMVICYAIYLVGTFFAVPLHLQDLARAQNR